MDIKKNKRNLKEIFISTFHEKVLFKDFLTLDITKEFQQVTANNRVFYAPSSKLKQVHRFLNNTILEHADYNEDVVFSYRKGTNTRDAVEKHSENKFFYQTDISNFYNNIHFVDVKKSLESQLTNIPVLDIKNYIEKILELVVLDDHIPVGFSTSPLLSNICLFKFDNALLQYCQENTLTYTRYSDDLIISGKNEKFINCVGNVIENLLKTHINSTIKINTEKTKIHKKGHNFKLLGFNILPNGIVTLPSADKKEVETLLYFFLTDQHKFEDYFKRKVKQKALNKEDKTLREQGIATLSGKLNAFNSMDKMYVSKLRKKYGNTIIDMFIRKLVK